MANTIQVRRGANADLPTLNAGELGFSTDSYQLYIGDGAANHEIAMREDSVVTKVAADSPYTATSSDDTILCDATDGAITINLPTAVGISGKKYNIKKIDSSANNVTIDPNGTETIDDASTLVISAQYGHHTVQSDNANWWVI